MKRTICLILSCVLLLGAGSVWNSPPSSDFLKKLPVVKVGEEGIGGPEQIVYIPANTPFPIRFQVDGSLLSETVQSTVKAKFERDLYVYKQWGSFDGLVWKNSHQLIDVSPSGGFDETGGEITTKLDIVK